MRALATMVALIMLPAIANSAVLVAMDDMDGGTLNRIGATIPALDGGPGDYLGIGSRNGWPQGFPSPGVPFSIADDSVFGYSNDGAPFPGDNEGIYGENSNLDNNYFAISDSDEFEIDQVAAWSFDITGYTELTLFIDMGGVSSPSSGGYSLDTDVKFTVQIDGGAVQTAFDLNPVDPGFVQRLMDDGTQSGGGRVLEVVGDNTVTKYLAEDGSAAGNTFLDKTPPSGPGAGNLDSFGTPITGTGSVLLLTMTCNFPFEAMVFDNIRIEGRVDPTPTNKASMGQIKKLYK